MAVTFPVFSHAPNPAAGVLMSVFFLELRHVIRSLYKSKGFTLVVVGMLALAIASNTIVFSVINAALLRPLPFPGPDRLVTVHWFQSTGMGQGDVSAAVYFLLERETNSFADITAVYPTELGVNLSGAGQLEYVKALRVYKDYTRVLRVVPVMGRDFQPEETGPHGRRSVLLSYRIWQNNFKSDPAVLGRTVGINGENYTVVGIMPPGFRSYPEADIWLSLQLSRETAVPGNNYRIIGRVRDDVSIEQAQEEVHRLSQREPELSRQQPGGVLVLEGLHDAITAHVRSGLLLMLLALVLVLMIVCANVMGLLLVRASARTREIAVRAALGSSWIHFMRVFFLESVLLTLMGGVLGMILAKELLPVVLPIAPANLSSMHIGIDKYVVLFTISVCAVVAFVLGLPPGLKFSSAGLNEMLQQASRGASISMGQTRTGRILVILQSGLTFVLLAGTTLLVGNFVRLLRVQPGFDPQNVSVVQVTLAGRKYRTTSSQQDMLGRFVEKIRAIPGVDAVASASALPLEKGLNLPAYPDSTPRKIEYAVEYRIISPDYFKAMGIPVLSGRQFSASDTAGTAPVAVLNEALAHQWFPKTGAIHQSVHTSDLFGSAFSDVPREIVGIVADVRESGMDRPASPAMYVPLPQAADSITEFNSQIFLTSIVIHTTRNVDLSSHVRDALQSVDPDLPIASLQRMPDIVVNSLARQRFYTLLISSFGALALFLTSMGLYGLLSYQLGLRVREIAIRMACGARRREVFLRIIRQGTSRVMIGAALGAFGALLLKLVLQPVVYNLILVNIWVIVSSTLLLGLTAIFASMLTAIRAAAIDPMTALRTD